MEVRDRFLVVAALAALAQLFAAPAHAFGAGKVSRSDLGTLTNTFGVAGVVSFTDGDGIQRVLAYDTKRPKKVTAEARVPTKTTLGWCRETPAGLLYACRATDYPFPTSGGLAEFNCVDAVGGETTCTCDGPADCVDMISQEWTCVSTVWSCESTTCALTCHL